MTEQVVPSFPEGTDGLAPIYLERVWPAPGMWAFMLLMTASLGIAYAQPFGVSAGIATFLLTSVAVVIGLMVNAPVIRVDERVLRVGRARLPLHFVGQFRIMNAAESKSPRDSNAHTDAYFLLRPGIKSSVMVEVIDTSDPHPYWQFSTRHPDELVLALTTSENGTN